MGQLLFEAWFATTCLGLMRRSGMIRGPFVEQVAQPHLRTALEKYVEVGDRSAAAWERLAGGRVPGGFDMGKLRDRISELIRSKR